MPRFSPLEQGKELFRLLSPRGLKELARKRLTDVVRSEAQRSKPRIADLQKLYPSAEPKELAQRLIDEKKNLAGMVGGVSGLLGVLALPADQLVVIPFLQLRLLCELATLYGQNLKSDRAVTELLELFFYANGVGQLPRSGTRILGTAAGFLLRRGGVKTVGRVLPVAGAAVSAYLNNQHLQQVGNEALRHYEGFGRARERAERSHTKEAHP